MSVAFESGDLLVRDELFGVKDGVHFFTAKWCGHCSKMKHDSPGVTRSGEDYEAFEHDDVGTDWRDVWVARDGSAMVKGYPCIYFKKGSILEQYRGKRVRRDISAAFSEFNATN